MVHTWQLEILVLMTPVCCTERPGCKPRVEAKEISTLTSSEKTQLSHNLSHMAITNTGGCYGILGIVSLASADGRGTVVALPLNT